MSICSLTKRVKTLGH